jgi:hypothetical protein
VKEGLRDERRAQKEGDFMDNFIERSSSPKFSAQIKSFYTNTDSLQAQYFVNNSNILNFRKNILYLFYLLRYTHTHTKCQLGYDKVIRRWYNYWTTKAYGTWEMWGVF